jgi:Protein of unknown function (DUF2971)
MGTLNSSGRLYRILSFDRAVQIFEKGELHFAHPSSWSDPYEVRLLHPASHQLFGQCWCTKGVSDAMWRIYSTSHLGVRISTNTRKLRQALEAQAAKLGYGLRLSEVSYSSQHVLNSKLASIRKNLDANFVVARAMDALFLKRDAFEHESEYRAVMHCPTATQVEVQGGIKLRVEPHKLIDSILLDPRAPDELAAAFSYYFKEKLLFNKKVQRSVLYKSPHPILAG